MPDLAELQRAIVAERRSRGFTTDPLQVFTLLVEEVGEVARELKRTWSPNYDDLTVERLAPELADIREGAIHAGTDPGVPTSGA